MTFQVSRGGLGPYETVVVQNESGGGCSIALQGATLLRWQMPYGTGLVDLVDGYTSAAELASQDGVRNGVLAPFPNRVSDARYDFAGVTHDLAPGSRDRLVYHGFLRQLDLLLDVAEVHGDTARLLFVSRDLRPGRFPGYPFAVDVTVEYVVGPTSLELAVTGRNVGEHSAPFASGWHPYFRLPVGQADDWTMTIPAGQAICVDDDLIPLSGGAAFTSVSGELDYRRGRRIGVSVIDGCWTALLADDRRTRTTLDDPSGNRLTVWQEGGSMHVFTGDTLARDRRRSVALEPVEAMTDAFNRCDVSLLPGESRTFRFGVEAALAR